MSKPEDIIVIVEPELFKMFHLPLQRGVGVRINEGSNIEGLLKNNLGLSEEYIEKRIGTVMLDGRPVDDKVSTVLTEGSRVALSAAMPGLAGAMLRSGGVYSSLRQGITYQYEKGLSSNDQCIINIVVFNNLIEELAPVILKTGIWMAPHELVDLLESSPVELIGQGVKLYVNSQEQDYSKHELERLSSGDELILIKASG